jgi:thioredoxin-like negative regulator of GroEL
MKPVVDRLEAQYKGKVDFVRYDMDTSAEGNRLAQQLNLQYVPSFLFVNRDGTISQQKVGEMTASEITGDLNALQ